MLLAQAQTPVPPTFAGPSIDWLVLAPVVVLAASAIVLLVTGALDRRTPTRGIYALWTMLTGGAVVALGAVQWNDLRQPGVEGAAGVLRPVLTVADAVVADGFAVFFVVLVGAAVAISALVANSYVTREGLDGPELYGLLMLSAAGAVLMAMANDLVVVFLGLEVLSIALYVLAGFHLRRIESAEAAIKYFVLGAFSSAFLLYGIALTYGATGTTNLFGIADFLARNTLLDSGLLLAGMALLLVGLGFKVAAAPFHMWTPDVYQGSPTPVVGFMASVAKAAGFAALLRVFVSAFGAFRQDWSPAIGALAVLTLLVGSLFAIVQTDVKRILAYSSIAHAGYILVGMQAGTADGVAGSLFYLFAYAFMVLGSFAVVTLVGRTGDAAHSLDDYRGLGRSRPFLAFAFTVFLLAQSGMPLTSGFLAKFGVIAAAVDARSYALAVVAMLAAVVAAFLYLRIIVAMYLTDPEGDTRAIPIPFTTGLALATTLAVTLLIGFFPDRLVDFAHDATLLVGLG